MSGFIKIQRKFYSHWLWEEKRIFSKAEAFLDLLQLAAFTSTKRVIAGNLFELKEGELVASVRYLSVRWNWGKDKVAVFLRTLTSDAIIRRETRQGETVIILCNYKEYNGSNDNGSDSKPDKKQTDSRQRADKVEEREEGEEVIIKRETDSESSKKKIDDDDAVSFWTNIHPTAMADQMNKLQRRINRLHPAWSKRPHFSAKELHALHENSRPWIEVEEEDWKLLQAYMDAAIPDDWRKDPRDLFQPDNRLALINIGPTSILGLADQWAKLCKRHKISTGIN